MEFHLAINQVNVEKDNIHQFVCSAETDFN